MTDPSNLTPFAAETTFAHTVDGGAVVIACVAGRFDLPRPGSTVQGPLQPAQEQRPPPMVDAYRGDPATSSLRYAGQGVAHRFLPEVYVNGTAWAPGGRAVAEMLVGVRVGSCAKQAHVSGPRFWRKGVFGLAPSLPEPFTSVPLTYENAFGGTGVHDGQPWQDPRNPVGCGLSPTAACASDRPLPRIEAKDSRMASWDDRVEVCGFGPIPPGWQPRLGHAGTYDAAWAEERAPLWPVDIQREFFCAAAAGLAHPSPLHGGEAVLLRGFSPDGDFAFALPAYRLQAKSYYEGSSVRAMMDLQAVLLEPDESAVTLIWRRTMPLYRRDRTHVHTVVRLLEPWEEGADGSGNPS